MRPGGRHAVAIASAVIGAACSVIFGTGTTQADNPLDGYAGKTIRYDVTGSALAVESLVYETNNGQQQATNVTLPWSDEFIADKGLPTAMVRVQNSGQGSIICRIAVDGRERAHVTSTGPHSTISCGA